MYLFSKKIHLHKNKSKRFLLVSAAFVNNLTTTGNVDGFEQEYNNFFFFGWTINQCYDLLSWILWLFSDRNTEKCIMIFLLLHIEIQVCFFWHLCGVTCQPWKWSLAKLSVINNSAKQYSIRHRLKSVYWTIQLLLREIAVSAGL